MASRGKRGHSCGPYRARRRQTVRLDRGREEREAIFVLIPEFRFRPYSGNQETGIRESEVPKIEQGDDTVRL
jgi:hypothetical protein